MVKLSDIELPMIFKDRLLFSYGTLNNWEIRPEEIAKSIFNTKWEDQRTRSLFFAHNDRDAQKWVGRIANPYILNGELFGDLEIHDADLALKMGPGKAPLGISAEIKWSQQYNQPTNFSYRAFAVVHNPEVVETLVNFSEQNKDGFNTATFQIPFKETTNFSEENGIVTSISARGSPIGVEKIDEEVKDEEVKEANFTEENKSNLMSAERGFNEIKMEEKQENVNPEVIEEVKEEVVEAVKEEAIVEAKEDEATEKVEESKEADFASFNDKFEKLVARVNALESKQAEFSEAVEEKSEAIEEEKVEEVEEVIEEVKEEEKVEEEPKESEKLEEVEESKEAEFSELADKIDKLADAIIKKEAAPMSTAEFGTKVINKSNGIIDRLTLELQK